MIQSNGGMEVVALIRKNTGVVGRVKIYISPCIDNPIEQILMPNDALKLIKVYMVPFC